jgi:transcription factor IIIB subunit 2
MNNVVLTALRIVTRLKKDWIATGRRPDGVCAAALLVASRAHGFNVSQDNTAQLFKISQDTLRKRLLEFKNTPSAQLNLQQFHFNDLDLEYDPPSFISGVLQSHSVISLDLGDDDSAPVQLNELENDEVFQAVGDIEEDSADFSKRRKMKIDNVTVNVPLPNIATTR